MPLLVRLITAIVLLSLSAASARAQSRAQASAPPPCSAPEHRQFDFWLGEWDVTTPAGQAAGKNRITSVLNGCVLLEEWTGTSGSTGKSFNLYDARRKRWHQTWVDGSGGLLELHGALTADGAMVLTGEQPARSGTGTVLNRITWTPRSATEVRQLWETSTDGGTTWTTAFDGIYRKVR